MTARRSTRWPRPRELTFEQDLAFSIEVPRDVRDVGFRDRADYEEAWAAYRDERCSGWRVFVETGAFDRPPPAAAEFLERDRAVLLAVVDFWRTRLLETRERVRVQVAFPVGDPRREDPGPWRAARLGEIDAALEVLGEISRVADGRRSFVALLGEAPHPDEVS